MKEFELSPELINNMSKGTLIETLGIEFLEAKSGFIRAKMPVDERTFQPFKLLHGGASAALMESIGSFGSHMMVQHENKAAVGIEINANHTGSATSGFVEGVGKIVHKGNSTHVWQIDIFREDGKLISTGRLTNLIKQLK